MNRGALIDRLIRHEGDREFPYDDATGHALRRGDKLIGNITIGSGINLSAGLSASERHFLLETRIAVAIKSLDDNVPQWSGLNDARREVLVEMSFNMGWPKLAGFTRFLAALSRNDFTMAAQEMLSSAWATQVGRRAVTLADAMRAGTFDLIA